MKGIVGFEVFYKKGKDKELIGYTNSDYTGDQDDRKGTSSYGFMMNLRIVS